MRPLLAPLLAVALVAGCGLAPEDAPRVLPRPTLAPSSLGPAPGAGARPTTLYLVRDDALAPVTRRTTSTGSPRTALQLLLRGPSGGEGGQGLTTALAPEAVLVEDVRLRPDGVVVVPLATVPSAGSVRSDEVLAYAQVVTTLTALRGVRAVAFTRDGAPLRVPRADGALSAGPLSRGDYAALL